MATAVSRRPAEQDYAPYYARYVSLVPDGDVLRLLEQQGAETQKLLRSVSEEKSQFRYAAGKWSIREVVGHIADTERLFTFRALHFARGDASPLPSMDENVWAKASPAHQRSLASLLDELLAVRASTLALFRSFTSDDLARSGVASNNTVTVRALTWITTGHERHHINVLKERYLSR